MSKKFSFIFVLLAIIFSLLGGLMAGLLFAPKLAIVEESDQNKVVTIEELRVVDENGKLLIKLGNGYGLSIYGQGGSRKIDIGGSGIDGSNISLWDYSHQGAFGGSYQNFLKSILYDGSYHTIVSSKIIALQNKNFGRAYIQLFENGGARIGVDDKDSKDNAEMSVDDKDPKGNAEMSVDEYGGRFDVFSKVDNISRASVWISEYGYGGISILDKDRYRLK